MSVMLLLLLTVVCWSLDLEEIKELAVKNHIDSVKSQLELESLEEKIKEVRAGILPSVSFGVTYTRWDTNYISAFVPENKYFANLRLDQRIFDKSLWEALKVARESKEVQNFVIEEVRQKLLAEVEKLYWAVLLKKEILKEKEESFQYWQDYFALVKEKYEQGIVPRYEFLRARAQLRQAKADLIRAGGELKSSINSLKAFLGIVGEVEIEGKLRKEALAIENPLRVLLEKSPTLKLLRARLKLARSKVKLKEAQYFPRLSFFFNYNLENIMDFDGGRLKEDYRHGYNFGIKLDFLLYDAGRRSAQIRQERIELRKISKELKFTENKLKNELETLLIRLRSAEEELSAREDSLLASQEALRFSTERYREGVGSQVELLEARKNYEQAKLSLLNSIYNYNSIVVDIKKLLGWF